MKTASPILIYDSKQRPHRVWFAKSNYQLKSGREQFTGMGPYPGTQIKNASYSMSICTFDPSQLTRQQAIGEGKRTCIWKGHGGRFGGQIWEMAHEMKTGDVVILETDSTDVHAIGVVTGTYKFNRNGFRPNSLELGAHIIPIRWKAVRGEGLMGGGLGDTQILRLVTTDRRAKLAQKILDAAGFPSETHRDILASPRKEQPYKDPELARTKNEGKVNEHIRKERERDPAIVKLAKKVARRIGGGTIQCEGCDVHIKKTFGYEVIDAHHVEPLSETGETETSISDLAMLCPTCHRLTHRVLADGLAKEFEAVNLVRFKHKLQPKPNNTLHNQNICR